MALDCFPFQNRWANLLYCVVRLISTECSVVTYGNTGWNEHRQTKLLLKLLLLLLFFKEGTHLTWLDLKEHSETLRLRLSFCLSLKSAHGKYAVDSPGAASEGVRRSTAGCFTGSSLNIVLWTGGKITSSEHREGKQAEQRKKNRKLHINLDALPLVYPH